MPILDQYPRVALDKITIRRADRQRREIDTSGLQSSILRIGVLQPLIVEVFQQDSVEPEWVLVSGERRLQSCRNLVEAGFKQARNGQDLTTIPVRLSHDITRIESRTFELEENIKREDLPWQDLVRSCSELHGLYKALDENWTQEETCEALSLTRGTVSIYLRVCPSLDDPNISSAPTVRSAYEMLNRREQRALGDAIDQLVEVPVPAPVAGLETALPGELLSGQSELYNGLSPVNVGTRQFVPASALQQTPAPQDSVLCEDFLLWGPQYSGQLFNLIHCDFPYGLDLFAGEQARGSEPGEGQYQDSRETYLALLDCLCRNLDRLLSQSGHLMFWYSGKLELETRAVFTSLAPSLEFCPFPLIWHKSDGKGIAGDWRHEPRHVYETAMLARRGSRQILEVKNDLYSCQTDRSLHASTKPEPMLRYFFGMLCDGHTRLLDPTCGSGASLRAGESLGAQVLGLEISQDSAETARRALRGARVLRQANQELV